MTTKSWDTLEGVELGEPAPAPAPLERQRKVTVDVSPGEHWCFICKARTNWLAGRLGVQRCSGCDDRFPCASKRCGHIDCCLARGAEP